MIIKDCLYGKIKDYTPTINSKLWNEIPKISLVSETIIDEEPAIIPSLLRKDMVGNIFDDNKLSEFHIYRDLIKEAGYRNIDLAEFEELRTYLSAVVQSARYSLYHVFDTVGIESKGFMPFSTGYTIVKDSGKEFDLTFFTEKDSNSPESNWLFSIQGNSRLIKVNKADCLDNFTIYVNFMAEPIRSINLINQALNQKDWKEAARLCSKIKDTVRSKDYTDSDFSDFLSEFCYDYGEYMSLIDCVSIEVTPNNRYKKALEIVARVASEFMIDYVATLYCLVYGHNKRRSNCSKSTAQLINIGVKNGNIEIGPNNQIKVKYISEPTKSGRKPKEKCRETEEVRFYAEPIYRTEEWQTEGHWRQYKKSGKKIWISPHPNYRHKDIPDEIKTKNKVKEIKVKTN